MTITKKYPRFFKDSETDQTWYREGVLYVRVDAPGSPGVVCSKQNNNAIYRPFEESSLDVFITEGKIIEIPIEEAVLIS
jgi:hypothetical protein